MVAGTQSVKRLLGAVNPFVLGKNATRPAPSHVLNGFVAATVGYSDRGRAIVRLLKSDDPPLEEFEFARSARWTDDADKLSTFQADLVGVVSPDRRIWKAVGSPVPFHAAMATNDPSDDNFGPALAALVEARLPEFKSDVEALFVPDSPTEPATSCAFVLVEDFTPDKVRTSAEVARGWFRSERSDTAAVLADSVSDFIIRLTHTPADTTRLETLQHLSRGLYFSTIMCILLAPMLELQPESDEPASLYELAPILVWGGMPPGDKDHPFVRVSAQAFQKAIERHRRGLATQLSKALETQDIPSTTPDRQLGRTQLLQLLASADTSQSKAQKTLDELENLPGIDLSGDVTDLDWCRRLIEVTHSEDHVASGIRSMGRKVGFIAPDRGFGSPRFVLETPLLATLVSGIAGEDGMDFEHFVDALRTRWGLVVGPGTDDRLSEEFDLWQGAGVARTQMKQNQEELRRRMVRAGLAHEYSDGHTEVAGVRR